MNLIAYLQYESTQYQPGIIFLGLSDGIFGWYQDLLLLNTMKYKFDTYAIVSILERTIIGGVGCYFCWWFLFWGIALSSLFSVE